MRAIEFAIRREELRGPVNTVAPVTLRSREVTAALARAMHRPHLLPLPEALIKVIFGDMGEETLLSSHRVVPRKLQEAHFKWLHGNVDDAMQAALKG